MNNTSLTSANFQFILIVSKIPLPHKYLFGFLDWDPNKICSSYLVVMPFKSLNLEQVSHLSSFFHASDYWRKNQVSKMCDILALCDCFFSVLFKLFFQLPYSLRTEIRYKAWFDLESAFVFC